MGSFICWSVRILSGEEEKWRHFSSSSYGQGDKYVVQGQKHRHMDVLSQRVDSFMIPFIPHLNAFVEYIAIQKALLYGLGRLNFSCSLRKPIKVT